MKKSTKACIGIVAFFVLFGIMKILGFEQLALAMLAGEYFCFGYQVASIFN